MIIIPTKKELEDAIKINVSSDKDTIMVVKPIYYWLGFPFVIPPGLSSDGFSDPFTKAFRNPLEYERLVFALPHDYGYRTQFIKSRAFWDSLAISILSETISKSEAVKVYSTLRATGFIAWHKNRKRGLEKYPEYECLIRNYPFNKFGIC